MNKNTTRRFWLMTAFLAILVPVACGPASIDPDKHLLLESTLEIKHEPGGCILAILSFKGRTGEEGPVLKDPLSYHGTLQSARFTVTRDGQDVRYHGPMTTLGAPIEDDWYILERGKIHQSRVRISDYYDFSKPGEYSVTYNKYYEPGGKIVLPPSNTVKFVIAN
jgi:hypothetical protein